MPTPIRGQKGRFQGSIGDGGKNTPMAPPTKVPVPAGAHAGHILVHEDGLREFVPPTGDAKVHNGWRPVTPHVDTWVTTGGTCSAPPCDVSDLPALAPNEVRHLKAWLLDETGGRTSAEQVRQVLADIATNPGCAPALRKVAAESEHTPGDALGVMWRDCTGRNPLRVDIAANPAIPTWVFDEAKTETHLNVRRAAYTNPNHVDLDTIGYRNRSDWSLMAAASRGTVRDIDTYKQCLASAARLDVRTALYSHRGAPTAVLEEHLYGLVENRRPTGDDLACAQAIISNPALPRDRVAALARYVNNPHPAVVSALRARLGGTTRR